MKRTQYDEIMRKLDRIENLLLSHKCDCGKYATGQQLKAVEEVLGYNHGPLHDNFST